MRRMALVARSSFARQLWSWKTWSAVLTVLFASLFLPAEARAQNGAPGRLQIGGMDAHLFRPAVDSKGLIYTNGTDIVGHLGFSFGLIVDGGFGAVPFTGFVNDDTVLATNASYCAERDNFLCGRLVDYMFTGTLHANIGLFNWVVVGLQVPIGVFATGANTTIPGLYNDPMDPGRTRALNYQGIGNISIHAKVRLLRAQRTGGFGLAGILQLELPTAGGSNPPGSQFVGDNTFNLWPIIAAEVRAHRLLRFGLNVGTRLMFGGTPTIPVGGRTMPTSFNAERATLVDPGTSVQYGPMLTYSFGIGFRLGDSPVELTADLYGASIFDAIDRTGGNSLEAIGGLKIFVERNSYLVLAGGGGIPIGGLIQSDVRGTVGFIFEPSIGDRDGDGYRDDDDDCPDDPEDFDYFEDEDGCPEPDNDRDGILDVDDLCPNIPEDLDGEEDQDGCPEGEEGDRDGDGIMDRDDQCPDEPEDFDQFEDEDGCPDPDNDQDGILDVDDQCPNEPEDFDGFEDSDGCPDPDNDRDHILDVDDSCPNQPETYNGIEDRDGCPDEGSVIVEGDSIVILEKIYFETDSAEIMARSYPILDAVAAALTGNPEIELVEIQGHADERSSDEYNIRLTSDRAAAVLAALANRGVLRSRLRSAGYGERCPVNPRHTPDAWEENRRVEFKIIRTVMGPTGVQLACPAGQELIPR